MENIPDTGYLSLRKELQAMSVTIREFGKLSTGEEISIYHIENSSGAFAEVIPYGAILVKVCVPV